MKLAQKLKADKIKFTENYIDKYTKAGKLVKLPVWNYIPNRNATMFTTSMMESGAVYTSVQSDPRYEQWNKFFGLS